MTTNTIITIGRQLGSGGRAVSYTHLIPEGKHSVRIRGILHCGAGKHLRPVYLRSYRAGQQGSKRRRDYLLTIYPYRGRSDFPWYGKIWKQ